MADSTVESGNQVAQWCKKFFREYIRDEVFSPYTGQKENNVFQIVKDLTKKVGDNITITLITRLTGEYTEDDDTLEGNEEDLGNYSDKITVHQQRKAVVRGDHEQSKALFDILKEGNYMLKKYAMEKIRDLKIARLYAVNNDGVTAYASTSEGDKDTHLGNNTDRFLFGALKSNRSTTDHSASLLNVDNSVDTLDRGIITLLKRMAKLADPHIMPITVEGNREIFVCFVGTNAFRDYQSDMDTVHIDAAPRSLKGNPLYHDGDILYRDVLTREIPEMVSIGDYGNDDDTVYPVCFCGAQAVGLAWSKYTKTIRNNGPYGRDYGNRKGTGICETRGAKQLIWNDVQHGMVKGYVAANADT